MSLAPDIPFFQKKAGALVSGFFIFQSDAKLKI